MLSVFGGSGCESPAAPLESMMVIREGQIVVPVVAQPVSVTVTRELAPADATPGRTIAGAIVVDVENAGGATGQLDLRVTGFGASVNGSVDATSGTAHRIPLSIADAQALAAGALTFRASGTLCPAEGCAMAEPPAGQIVTLRARVELTVEVTAQR
jgi:hypothetical protein